MKAGDIVHWDLKNCYCTFVVRNKKLVRLSTCDGSVNEVYQELAFKDVNLKPTLLYRRAR